jgi:phosphatidylglycerol:prolipoprotein diacylglycerol transferase
MYFAGYGVFRFFIEYFREPDAELGYRIELIKNDLSPALSHPPLSFSTGQILSALFVLGGLVLILIMMWLPGREPVRVYPAENVLRKKDDPGGKDAARERNRRRKLRKKLK